MIIDEEKLKSFGRALAEILPSDYWGRIEFRFAGGFCVSVEPKPMINFTAEAIKKHEVKSSL